MVPEGDRVRVLHTPRFADTNGTLQVFDEDALGMQVRRVFLVFGVQSAQRGAHAHRECSQILTAVHGAVTVTFESRYSAGEITLGDSATSLELPPLTWATQTFHSDDAVLMVVCDRDYLEADYIRDHADFLSAVLR